MEAPEVRFAKSGDVSIAYSVLGDGPFGLVFVGGWARYSVAPSPPLPAVPSAA